MKKRKDTHRLTVYLDDDAWNHLNDNLNTSFTTSNSYGARSELVNSAVNSYFQPSKYPMVYYHNIMDGEELASAFIPTKVGFYNEKGEFVEDKGDDKGDETYPAQKDFVAINEISKKYLTGDKEEEKKDE